MNKNAISALISLSILLCDFITKQIIVNNLKRFESIKALPFLNIVHYENEGAAFGMFANLGNSFFIVISLIAIGFIIFYLLKTQKGIEQYSVAMLLGGAAGNLIDRIRTGKVIDFIDVYVGKWHWPAFNIADSALTVGIILFIIANLKAGKAAEHGNCCCHK